MRTCLRFPRYLARGSSAEKSSAADSSVADDFSALDPRARYRGKRRQVRIPGRHAETMIHDHQPSVTGVVFRNSHDAIGGGVYRRAVIRGDIHACMKRAFTAERIEAFPERVGDVAHNGPNRRRIA